MRHLTHLRFVVVLGLAIFVASHGQAFALTSRANSHWFSNSDPQFFNGTTAGGAWTLGANNVSFQGVPGVPVGPVPGVYPAAGAITTGVRTSGGSSGKADSTILVGPALPSGLFPFTLTTNATANAGAGLFDPFVDAVARARDPQSILTAGMFDEILSLGAGSSIFTEDPARGSARASFLYTAPDLNGPLASLTLTTALSGIDAVVTFASDPRLSFFAPITGLPISAAQVESLLESAAGLGTASGLSNTLPLFEYRFDLTGVSLPQGAALGAEAENFAEASPIPEPSTWLLFASGLVGLLGYSWRRRKQSAS